MLRLTNVVKSRPSIHPPTNGSGFRWVEPTNGEQQTG